MRIIHVMHNESVSRTIIGLVYWRVVKYFRRLFCRGDKFMCRETFSNRNEYYTRSCVFIDNNNNYNNGSSGNNHCTSRPLPWQTHIHTGPPFWRYRRVHQKNRPSVAARSTPHVPVYHMSNLYILPSIVNNLSLPPQAALDFAGTICLCAFTKNRKLLIENR